MKASNILLEHIKKFEGCRLKAYRCPAGIWTIGIGHTKGVKEGQAITEQQAMALLKGDLLPVENYLNKFKTDWTQGQFDAVADFCFNCGTAAFLKSTLRKKILMKAKTSEIEAGFKAWNKAKIKGVYTVLPGLVKRREWECARWSAK